MKFTALRFFFILCTALPCSLQAQSSKPGADFDVLSYRFALELSDETDEIVGAATIDVRSMRDGLLAIEFDLVDQNERSGGTGMRVTGVTTGDLRLTYTRENNRLKIALAAPLSSAEELRVTVAYHGTPADGLIISQNEHGDRTFFGDNWPDRARHWLPVVDHPSEKAAVSWDITAPSHYQVIANGRLVEETDMAGGRRLTRWRTDAHLPTKVMVMGAARFAVEHVGSVGVTPVESWVFPQNRTEGFKDLSPTLKILEFYETLIGPYPFAKLAGVQSKTRYGGMENASAIFYSEDSITGTGSNEPLIAHEVAHQWFGDSVTETDWPHVWLSEGFATYLADMWIEHAHGREAMVEKLQVERAAVYQFNDQAPLLSVIDTVSSDPLQLLNPNSYQKGAWVLHMLRHRLGDEVFTSGLKIFYERYRGKNATTADFRKVLEELSQQDLAAFFKQWLDRPDEPILECTWWFDKEASELVLQCRQTQPGEPFDLPVEAGIHSAPSADGGRDREEPVRVVTLRLGERAEEVRLPCETEPARITLDPNTRVLLRWDLRKKR